MMIKVIKVVGDDDAEEGFRPLWPCVRCALKTKQKTTRKGDVNHRGWLVTHCLTQVPTLTRDGGL